MTTTLSAVKRFEAASVVLRLTVAAALALGGLLAPVAMGASAEQQGAQTLRSHEAGQRPCSSLTPDDFDRIGEYVMGRMLGSSGAHGAMDRQMAAMMGSRGDRQAHEFMGRRFAACATGTPPVAFGAAMGMMGAGMMGSSYGGDASALRSGAGRSGGMMGFDAVSTPAGTAGVSWTVADTVIVALLGLLVALAAGALVTLRRDRRAPRVGRSAEAH